MDDMPNLSKEEVERLLSQDIDELYIKLSESVPLVVDGRIVQQSREQALARGRGIFERVKDKLRQKICIEWDYCKRKKEKTVQEGSELFGAILGLIGTLKIATGLAAVWLALILFKIGLSRFCGCTD